MKTRRIRILTAAAALGLGALAILRAQSGGFQFHGPLGRIITPNGDGRNDLAIICFDNFSDSGVAGRIYTLLGSEVAAMPRQDPALAGCPGGTKPQSMTWDGRSEGSLVRSGIYVYRLQSEGLNFTGTLLVVR